MKKTSIHWRYLLPLFLLSAIIVLAVLFRTFLVAYWINPLALMLWAILRVFLSVHQSVYWTGLTFLAFFLALRILPQKADDYKRYPGGEVRGPANRAAHWYQLIRGAPSQEKQDRALKMELQALIDDWQRTKRITSGIVYTDKGANHTDPLPTTLANLLDTEPETGKDPLRLAKNLMKSRFFRWNPWQAAQSKAYEDSIQQVVGFIEKNMETNFDEQSGNFDDR